MDGGLGDKIREILNDPDAMAKIAQIAAGLGTSAPAQNTGGQPVSETPVQSGAPQDAASAPRGGPPGQGAAAAMSALSSLAGKGTGQGGGDGRFALLTSLRPLLKEDKRKKIDNMKTALTIANIIGSLKKHT